MDKDKPPVLSDEEIDQVWPDSPKEIIDRECPLSSSELETIARQVAIAAKVIAQAQRDADVEWYEGNIDNFFNIDASPIIQQARHETAREINNDLLAPEVLEIGRKAIEDALVDFRNNRISQLNRGNGLVIREEDGRDSSVIRFGPETALKIGINAIWQSIKSQSLGGSQ